MNWGAEYEQRLPILYAGVAIAIVVIAFIFVPSPADQKLQQLLADRRYPDAKTILLVNGESALSTERGWADAIEVNAQLGDVVELQELIDFALGAFPDSDWPRQRKSEVVSALGSERARISWAEAQFDRFPTPESFRYVVGAAQARGDTKREEAILERAITLEFTNNAHLERLAAIKAVAGKFGPAIDLLRQVVETTPNPALRTRLTLFSLQVDNGQPEEALEIALRTGLDPWSDASRGAYIFALREEHRDSVRALLNTYTQGP